MSALFEGGHAVCVEDHLVTDVVIALLVSFQLFRGRTYRRRRTPVRSRPVLGFELAPAPLPTAQE